MKYKNINSVRVKIFTQLWPLNCPDGINVRRGYGKGGSYVVLSGSLDNLFNYVFELSQEIELLEAEWWSREIMAKYLFDFLDPCVSYNFCKEGEVFVGLYRDIGQAIRMIPVEYLRMDFGLMGEDSSSTLIMPNGRVVFSEPHPCFTYRESLLRYVRGLRNDNKAVFHQIKHLQSFYKVLNRSITDLS